jgi:uncharacterized protein
MGTLLAAIYRHLRRRRPLVLVATALVVATAAYGASRLRTTEDLMHLLPDGEPAVLDLQVLNQAFGGTHRVLLDLRWTGEDAPLDLVEFGDRLEEEILALPQVTRVTYRFDRPEWMETLTRLPALLPLLASSEDLEEMAPLLEPEAVEAALQAAYERFTDFEGVALRETLRIDPLGLSRSLWERLGALQSALRVRMQDARLTSEDGRSLLMIVGVETPSEDSDASRALLDGLDAAVEAASPGPHITVHHVSAHRSTQDNYWSIRSGTQIALTATTVALILIFFLCFGRWWLGLAVFVPTTLALLLVVGALGFGEEAWSLIPIGYAAAVVGLTVDYAVHLAFRYDRAGEGTARILERLTVPILLSGLTTAGGFFCLWFGSIPAQRMVGSFAGFSVLLAVFLALVLLPQILPENRRSPSRRPWVSPESALRKILSGTAKHPILVSLVCWGLLALVMAGLGRLRFEGDPNGLNSLSPATRLDEQAFKTHFGSPDAEMIFAAVGRDLDHALVQAEDLTRHLQDLRRSGTLRSMSSPSPILPSLSRREENLTAWRSFFTDARIAEIRARLLESGKRVGFHPDFFQPFLDLLASPPSPPEADGLQALADERIKTYRGETLVLLTARPADGVSPTAVEDAIREAFPTARVSSLRGLAERLMGVVRSDIMLVALVAGAVIVVLLSLTFPLVAVTLVPVMGGLLASLGLLGWMDRPLNIVSVMVVAFLFGTGIDYGVFVVHAWKDNRGGPADRLAPTLTAIAVSAATTLFGFIALAMCEHPALSTVGQVAAIGIGATFLCALLLLPPLLRIFLPTVPHWKPATCGDVARTTVLYAYFSLMAAIRIVVIAPVRLLLRPTRGLLDRLDHLAFRSFVLLHPGRAELETCPIEGPCLIVANHQGLADIFYILAVRPDAALCAKSWIARVPIAGQAARLLGQIFYQEADLEQLTKTVKDRLDRGRAVAFFAEGGRFTDGRIHRLRLGVFHIASRLGIPVVPALVTGTGLVSPKGTAWMRRYPASLRFLEPQHPPAGDEGRGIKAWAGSVRDRMTAAAEEEARRLLLSGPGCRAVSRHYINQSPLHRHYAVWKLRMDPWPVRLAAELPPRGTILDIGCGQGLSAIALTMWSPDRQVVGLDTDAAKIRSARAACPHERARFIHDDVLDWEPTEEEPGEFDGALLLDVLHYWPVETQAAILARAALLLSPGGILLVRDTARDAAHFGETARLERWARAIGWNRPSSGGHVFLTRVEMRRAIEAAGFEVLTERGEVPAGTANVVYRCGRAAPPDPETKG